MLMSKELNIDKLLDVYCEGIYAMDPKITLPFWDYDFGPIYGDLWIKKILQASHRSQDQGQTPRDVSKFFENVAVPRKEIIYSLVDLKVGKVNQDERMFFVNFWWDVVKEFCQRDCMVERSNIVHTDEEISGFLDELPWEKADAVKARQVGNIAMNLNSLAYGLYTDVFAHNSMENFGAYDVSEHFGGRRHIMVIKQWANLRPVELYPRFKDFRFDKLNIFAVYKDMDFTVDIYTHQIYSGSTAEKLVQYAVVIDNEETLNEVGKLEELNEELGQVVVDHFQDIQGRGFEEAKRIWILSRNYQFKDFFASLGMDWHDQEMLDQVKGKELLETEYWDLEKYSKEVLFEFWKRCFDPRRDTYYDGWDQILKDVVKEYS